MVDGACKISSINQSSHACDNPFTVKHILVECSDFTYIRNKYYTTTDVHTLFREVDSSKITEYLKEIKLFDKI